VKLPNRNLSRSKKTFPFEDVLLKVLDIWIKNIRSMMSHDNSYKVSQGYSFITTGIDGKHPNDVARSGCSSVVIAHLGIFHRIYLHRRVRILLEDIPSFFPAFSCLNPSPSSASFHLFNHSASFKQEELASHPFRYGGAMTTVHAWRRGRGGMVGYGSDCYGAGVLVNPNLNSRRNRPPGFGPWMRSTWEKSSLYKINSTEREANYDYHGCKQSRSGVKSMICKRTCS